MDVDCSLWKRTTLLVLVVAETERPLDESRNRNDDGAETTDEEDTDDDGMKRAERECTISCH